jgi:hypothetical protein
MPDSKKLTPAESAVLLVLMVEAREVSNSELKERYHLTLDGKSRVKLNDRKLVESRKPGRAFVHQLTDQGWAECHGELNLDSPRARALGAALSAVLGGLNRYLERSDLRLSDVFAPFDDSAGQTQPVPRSASDVEAGIRDAYQKLAKEPKAWVSLTRLRPLLGDVPKAEVDGVLRSMNRMPDVNLIPESNQKVLSPSDREAAVIIGDQDKHFLSIGAL